MANGLPSNTVQPPSGILSKSWAWIMHPQFSDADPIDWFAFFVLLTIAGVLWSKVVRQTLEAV